MAQLLFLMTLEKLLAVHYGNYVLKIANQAKNNFLLTLAYSVTLI